MMTADWANYCSSIYREC